jgi:hypothetical protein
LIASTHDATSVVAIIDQEVGDFGFSFGSLKTAIPARTQNIHVWKFFVLDLFTRHYHVWMKQTFSTVMMDDGLATTVVLDPRDCAHYRPSHSDRTWCFDTECGFHYGSVDETTG